MKAIVLAAGYGTRMQPLSRRLPKPLMPVVGRPMLWHIITKLGRSKAAAVGVNCHHMAERVQEYVLSAGFGLPVILSHEPAILGSGGGIAGFRGFLEGEDYFVVHNGDMLSSIDIAAVHEDFLRHAPLCALVLRDAPGYNNVSLDSSGFVTDLRGMLNPAGFCRRLAYSGICFFSAEILRFIPRGESDFVLLLLEIIRAGAGAVRGIIAPPCVWSDVGSPARYLRVHRDILIGRQQLVDASCMPGAAVYTGRHTRIGEGVRLAGFVSVGDNCRIGSGCSLENCVVWDRTEIPDAAAFKNSIIGPGWSEQVQEER